VRRHVVGLGHAAYWGVHIVGAGLVLAILGAQRGNAGVVESLAVAWRLLLIASLPNAAAFYVAYGPLFSRLLARRRVLALWIAGGATCAATAGLGFVLARLLFGRAQPVFASPGEMAAVFGLFSGLAALHLVAALVLRSFVRWYGEIQEKEELRRGHREMELALLRARLDPHFLFNTLNNIDVLIASDPRAASRYLNELSGLLRFVLYEAGGTAIPLADELAFIERYIALERIRTRSPRYVEHAVVGDPAGLSIAPMTFIPFVENAFKHTESARRDGAIRSRIVIDGTRVTLDCANRTAPGAPDGTPHPGIGDSLVRRRLELLYPRRHTLTTEQRDGMYRVQLTITAA
jgi:hypothetical protein